MFTLKRLKTLLLGLAVILITFAIFVALPAILPPIGTINCEAMWSCSTHTIYDTWMWGTPEQPEYEDWTAAHMRVEDTDDILDGLHRIALLRGLGALSIVVDPENENRIIISGYLQYGFFLDARGRMGIFPLPEYHGVLARRSIYIKLYEYYEGARIIRKLKEELAVTTDWDGFFSVGLELDSKARYYEFVASYKGETVALKKLIEVYLPVEVYYTTYKPEFVPGKPGIAWWVWLVIGLAVISGGFLLYRYLRRLRMRIPLEMELLLPDKEKETPKVPLNKEEEVSGGDISQIEIGSPDILDSLLDVWGVNEPVSFLVHLKDIDGEVLSSQTCKIDWGDGETVQAFSNEDGRIRLEHTFTIKGEYVITISYTDEKTGKEISSWKKIRIVEYREEMVRLFNEMLEILNIRDIKIEPEMTAREVELLLAERIEGVSIESIRKIVAGFEEANYSIHPVTRESYVAMYLAIREVLGDGG